MSSRTFIRALRLARVAFAGVALAAVLGACSSSSEDGSSGSSGSSSGSQSTACEKDTRKDIYTAGLAKQNAGLTVKIVESSPSPPQKGTNTMTLQIADASGKPLDGATVAVTPWMPDHAHGSALTPVATGIGGGRYAVTKIYYPMPGLWQVTVSVQMPGAAAQEVTFNFCFDG
jgi:ABC-type glycerol-3-phosphate transport system substrate-binding protein